MNNNAKQKLKEYHDKLKSGEVKKIVTTPLDKLEKNPKSLRLAINATCYQCMGQLKTASSDIRNCTSPSCGLYQVRPYQE